MKLKEFAKHLGLSPTTVSRALSGYPEVRESTRKLVADAAIRLGYRPNINAVRLVTGRAGAIGILMERGWEVNFAEFLSGTGECLGDEDTHSHPVFGAVIRVFEGIFSHDGEVPDSNTHTVRFTCLFPLKAAVSRGIVKVALRGQIREELRAFPTFRAGVVDPASGKVKVWWLWDGKDEIRVGEIDVSQRRLPIRGVWNDTLLIARIEQDWTPETDLT